VLKLVHLTLRQKLRGDIWRELQLLGSVGVQLQGIRWGLSVLEDAVEPILWIRVRDTAVSLVVAVSFVGRESVAAEEGRCGKRVSRRDDVRGGQVELGDSSGDGDVAND
jgi:hypothetical protein